MLLTIDLGNTCIKLGLFDKEKQLSFIFIPTFDQDYRAQLLSFIYKAGVRENMIENVIISSVVPSVKVELIKTVRYIFNLNPIEIDVRKDYGIHLVIDNPEEIGEDLLVMCAYAHHLFDKDLLVCSLGTCSVFSFVDKAGNFRGCSIAPGFKKMAESLYSSSALLSEFKVEKKNTFIAKNTTDAMNVGFFNGYIGMIEYLINGMEKELGKDLYVVACGGESRDVADYTNVLDVVDPDFVSKGLNYIYNRYYV